MVQAFISGGIEAHSVRSLPHGCGQVLRPEEAQTEALAIDEAAFIQRIADAVVAKLAAQQKPKPDEVLTSREAMRFLGAHSQSALYRATATLGVSPVLRGRYRRRDLENALARRAYFTPRAT